MCFSSSAKTPKTNANAIPAPEPVLTEEPKGIAVGDEDTPVEDGKGNGKDSLKVTKDPVPESATALSSEDKKKVETVKTATPTKVKGLGSIKRSLTKATSQPK